jgi:hypothetical protein
MIENEIKQINLTHFFAGARAKALAELERRMADDPSLDPNWTFSDIMQELLEAYLREQK